jgi:hypothetical protein
LLQQIKAQCSGMAAVLPFASTTVIKASSSSQAEIYYGLAKAVDVSAAAAEMPSLSCHTCNKPPGSCKSKECARATASVLLV